MNITVIGTGYVGLVTGACFSEMGNNVYCVDVIEDKINNLKKGIIPIYEPQLKDMVVNNQEKGNLFFTLNLRDAVSRSEIYFIAVGTPMSSDGGANLDFVFEVAREIGEFMDKDCTVVVKSTVPVGTGDKVKNIIQTELDKRGVDFSFGIVSNPEFLKEGTAVSDCMRPDRVIIGSDDTGSFKVMKDLYHHFVLNTDNFITMDLKSAEMTKYAANSMLATKISFMNEMANICECTGADVNNVRRGIGSDHRIGYNFIYPGCGYGGSCFPKDVQALIKTSEENGYDAYILNSVERVNKNQKMVLVNKVCKHFGEDLSGLCFGVWGLAFKPDTDDMREATSITVINELTKRGAKVKAYDPKAINEAKEFYLKDNLNVEYVERKYDALIDVDAMILITEWKEFRNPDFIEMKKLMKNPIIFDGRNQYNQENLKDEGFNYYQIGIKK
ncbi:UDP-glucose dehydrogenase family protein [Methanobrevibacter sp. UBA412]|uniref:UDP-glucose dehydrogenase family protein n=1 Tax=Methanobrevibacter sp. UBA412 TaxID=1915486 RepID=UPI0039B8AA62